MSSSSIGQSAGCVYIEIFGKNDRLANDLKQTDSMLRKHAAAMAGLQVFKPTLFTSQLAGIAAMARGSGALHSQLHAMSNLAPKLGALVSPFQAMRTAMTGMQNLFNPGNVVKSAVAAQTAALEAAWKKQVELKKRIGVTPSQARADIANYVEGYKKAKQILFDYEKKAFSGGSPSADRKSALGEVERLRKEHLSAYQPVDFTAGMKAEIAAVEAAEARRLALGKKRAAAMKKITVDESSPKIDTLKDELRKTDEAVLKLEHDFKQATVAKEKLDTAHKNLKSVAGAALGKVVDQPITATAAKAALFPLIAQYQSTQKEFQQILQSPHSAERTARLKEVSEWNYQAKAMLIERAQLLRGHIGGVDSTEAGKTLAPIIAAYKNAQSEVVANPLPSAFHEKQVRDRRGLIEKNIEQERTAAEHETRLKRASTRQDYGKQIAGVTTEIAAAKEARDARKAVLLAANADERRLADERLERANNNLQQIVAAEEKAAKELHAVRKKEVADARAQYRKMKSEIESQIKGNAISEAEAKARLAPYVKAVKDAHANLQATQKIPKFDIMFGGAVAAITNVISGVMSFGKIVWGVASSIFSVFKGIFNAVASVAHAIVNVLGSAFTFLKNLAVHTFQIVSVAALAVGTAMVAGLRSVFEKGKDLLNTFAQTGVKVKEALIIGTAASMTGVDKENIATQINRMQRAISGIDKEGPKIANALRALGIDLAKLQAMSPTDQMTAITNGLAKISNPADRAAVAINIFSVRGSQMISMMLQMAEAIKLAKQQWGQAGEAFDKNKDKFAYIARSIEGITQVKIPSFFAGIATPLANTLSWLSDKLNAFDPFKSGFKIGTKIDEYLRLIIGAFQKGRLMEWLGLELKVAFKEAVNYLIAGLMIAGDVLSSILHIEGLFPLIGKGLAGAFEFAVGTFLQAFQGILPTIAASFGYLIDRLCDGLTYAKNIVIGMGLGGIIGKIGGGVLGGLATGGNSGGIAIGAAIGSTIGTAAGGAAGGYLTDTGPQTYNGQVLKQHSFQEEWGKGMATFNVPGRAAGGGVKAGQPYLIGEKGPEIFVPTQNGDVISNKNASQMPRALADGTSDYSKHDWLAESAQRAKGVSTKNSPASSASSHGWHGGVERGPGFPKVSISEIGLDRLPTYKSNSQDVPMVFPSPAAQAAFEKMEAERKLTLAQKMQQNGLTTVAEVIKKLGEKIDYGKIGEESSAKYLHPNKEAEAKKDKLVKERDDLVAQQKALAEQVNNPRTPGVNNAKLADLKKQIAEKQGQINSGELSPHAEEQAKYDVAKLQEQEAYQQAKINEQKAYNESTGADDAKHRQIKKLQRQIDAKEKEIEDVQGTGPRDVMGVGADKTRLAALKKQLIAQGLVGSNGKPLDVSSQPEPGRAGVASGFAGTMSGWAAGRLGNLATDRGGTAKMEEHLKNIDQNTRGLTTGYGQ